MSDAARRFAIQRAITDAAQRLNTEQFAEFKRLCKKLVYGPAFQLLALDCRDERLRRQLLDCLAPVLTAAGLPAATLTLHTAVHAADDTPPDVAALEIQLRQLAAQHPIIHCLGLRAWLDAEQRPGRWDALNIRRERIAEHVPRRLLLWLDADGIQQLLTLAPDWWAWRAGVYVFTTESTPMPAEGARPQFDRYENRPTQVQAGKRIAELREWLRGELEPELAWPLWFELGDIYYTQGWLDQALEAYQQHVLPLQKMLDDMHGVAVTQGRIADILAARSQFDEALRIYQQEQLSVYELQGNIRDRAVTQSKIAEVLTMRGQFDEALRIRRHKVLPAFEQLGDVRACAVTQSKIADILMMRGQLDKALRIYQQEVLPIYEQIGDARSCAVVQGKIAVILAERGQLDEALRIYQYEQLPVFEQLGDVRGRAVTQGNIANILVKRGQLDEALRIRLQEELPAFELLGNIREETISRANIAQLLWQRNAAGDRVRAAELFTQVLQSCRQLQLAETAAIEASMRERGLPIPPAADCAP